jgi:glutamate carboxypeptidase
MSSCTNPPVARRFPAPVLGLALAALLTSRAVPLARAGGLSTGERLIVQRVAERNEEAVALLERVVNIPSATENLAGVRAVGKIFAVEFERIGFTTRWESLPPSMGRAGHLIAERAGTRGKRLLLIGHLDTVLEGRRFERRSGRAFGTGTADMKGGDVVLLFALKALHDAGRLDGARVAVILSGDEESVGEPVARSRAPFLELARRSDVALAFEEAIDDTATVARRGFASWTLRVKARTGHSSGILGEGLGGGAIYEAARILDAFRQELAGELPRGLTLNPSLIVGGTRVEHADAADEGSARGKTNVVPGEAVVEGDLRFLSDAQRDAAATTMRAIAARSLRQTSAVLDVRPEYPAMAPTPGNHALLAVLDQASHDLDLGPIRALPPAKRGAGDISFIASLLSGLDGLGIHGERTHAPDEWADLAALPAQIQRAALLIDRLTHD